MVIHGEESLPGESAGGLFIPNRRPMVLLGRTGRFEGSPEFSTDSVINTPLVDHVQPGCIVSFSRLLVWLRFLMIRYYSGREAVRERKKRVKGQPLLHYIVPN